MARRISGTVTVEGTGKLTRALDDGARDLDDRSTNRKAGEVLEGDARTRAPVRTGELRGSGRVAPARRSVAVSFTAGHAPFVEFGTRFMDAQPFLGPAREAREGEIIGLYEDHYAEVMDEIDRRADGTGP